MPLLLLFIQSAHEVPKIIIMNAERISSYRERCGKGIAELNLSLSFLMKSLWMKPSDFTAV